MKDFFKNKCEIVRDLLPLYADESCSKLTKETSTTTKSTPTNIDQTNVSSIIFHNGIIIDSQADRIEVYNINGQMLKYANNNTISISDLQYGIYIIKCTHDNETKITKIINY